MAKNDEIRETSSKKCHASLPFLSVQTLSLCQFLIASYLISSHILLFFRVVNQFDLKFLTAQAISDYTAFVGKDLETD